MSRMVYLAPVEWASIRQRPQHLAQRLADAYDLVYAEPVGLRSARLGDLGRIFQRVARNPGPRAPFPLFRPRYAPVLGLPGAGAFNRRWLWRQAQACLPKGRDRWILWLSTPSLLAEALVERTSNRLVVYDCMDHYAAFHTGSTRRRIERTEARLVGQADVVFASSAGLAERLRHWRPNVTLAPNGVDFETFALPSPPPPPAWRRRLTGPVIGYYGTLGGWLDYALLSQLARSRPDWSWVLIGPLATREAATLLALDNVYHLGPVPYEELPRHAAHFDVGIVPFQINELTRCVHPLKALEYLALGLPTVASELPDLKSLSHAVRLASGAASWLAELDLALAPTSKSPSAVSLRRGAARNCSWQSTMKTVVGALAAAGSPGRPRDLEPARRAA